VDPLVLLPARRVGTEAAASQKVQCAEWSASGRVEIEATASQKVAHAEQFKFTAGGTLGGENSVARTGEVRPATDGGTGEKVVASTGGVVAAAGAGALSGTVEMASRSVRLVGRT